MPWRTGSRDLHHGNGGAVALPVPTGWAPTPLKAPTALPAWTVSGKRKLAVFAATPDAFARDDQSTMVTLGPPCDFIRGVDAAELKRFREGNLLYRMGSHNGSKGELSSLTTLSRNRSEEWPSRTASISGVDSPGSASRSNIRGGS